MDEQTKKQIDDMDIETMLRLNRFAPVGDPMFTGETGKYFLKVMHEKRAKLQPGEWSAISRQIGWE